MGTGFSEARQNYSADSEGRIFPSAGREVLGRVHEEKETHLLKVRFHQLGIISFNCHMTLQVRSFFTAMFIDEEQAQRS